MKDILHSIASICLVVWLIGFFVYQLRETFHIFLVVALIAGLARFLMQKDSRKTKG